MIKHKGEKVKEFPWCPFVPFVFKKIFVEIH